MVVSGSHILRSREADRHLSVFAGHLQNTLCIDGIGRRKVGCRHILKLLLLHKPHLPRRDRHASVAALHTRLRAVAQGILGVYVIASSSGRLRSLIDQVKFRHSNISCAVSRTSLINASAGGDQNRIEGTDIRFALLQTCRNSVLIARHSADTLCNFDIQIFCAACGDRFGYLHCCAATVLNAVIPAAVYGKAVGGFRQLFPVAAVKIVAFDPLAVFNGVAVVLRYCSGVVISGFPADVTAASSGGSASAAVSRRTGILAHKAGCRPAVAAFSGRAARTSAAGDQQSPLLIRGNNGITAAIAISASLSAAVKAVLSACDIGQDLSLYQIESAGNLSAFSSSETPVVGSLGARGSQVVKPCIGDHHCPGALFVNGCLIQRARRHCILRAVNLPEILAVRALIKLISLDLIVRLTPGKIHRSLPPVGSHIVFGFQHQLRPFCIQRPVAIRQILVSPQSGGSGELLVLVPPHKRIILSDGQGQSDRLSGIACPDGIRVIHPACKAVNFSPEASAGRGEQLPFCKGTGSSDRGDRVSSVCHEADLVPLWRRHTGGIQLICTAVFLSDRKNCRLSLIAASVWVDLQVCLYLLPLGVQDNSPLSCLRIIIFRGKVQDLCPVFEANAASVRLGIPAGEQIAGHLIAVQGKMCVRRYGFSLIGRCIIIHVKAVRHAPVGRTVPPVIFVIADRVSVV